MDAEHGWLVPAWMQFERVLGADWGPESLRLLDVQVTPEPQR